MPTVDGQKIVFCNRRNGEVRVFDATNPQQLKVFPNHQYVLKGAITDRAVWYKGRVFIPAFDWGILYETPKRCNNRTLIFSPGGNGDCRFPD